MKEAQKMKLELDYRMDLVVLLQAIDTMRLKIMMGLKENLTGDESVDKSWFKETTEEYERLTILRNKVVKLIK